MPIDETLGVRVHSDVRESQKISGRGGDLVNLYLITAKSQFKFPSSHELQVEV